MNLGTSDRSFFWYLWPIKFFFFFLSTCFFFFFFEKECDSFIHCIKRAYEEVKSVCGHPETNKMQILTTFNSASERLGLTMRVSISMLVNAWVNCHH